MTRVKLSLVIAVSMAWVGLSAHSDEPTPKHIVEKAIRAHGGEERLNGLTGFRFKERVTYEKGPVWSFEVDVSLPSRYRSELKSGPRIRIRQPWWSTATMVGSKGEIMWKFIPRHFSTQ
jgi:hypothetical protein